MAAKKTTGGSSKTSSSASKTKKKLPRVKDLTPRKDVRGGATDHPTGGGKKNDY